MSVSGKAVVKDGDNHDMTAQFIVTTTNGALTINKRNVTLTSATAEKEYDGTPLTNGEVKVTNDDWAPGEGATYGVTGTQTLVGATENTFTYTLNDNTKADNYNITPNNGTLTVKKRNAQYTVTLKANSGTFTYDGTEKTVKGYAIGNNASVDTDGVVSASFTAENNLTYTITGMTAEINGTDAGTYTINVTGTPMVKDSGGNDVSDQFAVSVESGTLEINKRAVTLTSATDSKVYDGAALTNGTVTVGGDKFAGSEGATYNVTGTQTLPGESANAFTYALNAGTKADNYSITKTEGVLTVTDRTADGDEDDVPASRKYEITVTANSDTQTYDGAEHSVSGFTTSPTELKFGDVTYTLSGIAATASRTDAGETAVEITGTPVVKDGNGNDLTEQFTVNMVKDKLDDVTTDEAGNTNLPGGTTIETKDEDGNVTTIAAPGDKPIIIEPD